MREREPHLLYPHPQSVQAQSLLLASKRDQETELRELRQNKELLGQWEKQIADIIQWVTEEKEARAYLKSVAKKLADDVETLKTTAGTLGRVRIMGHCIAKSSMCECSCTQLMHSTCTNKQHAQTICMYMCYNT